MKSLLIATAIGCLYAPVSRAVSAQVFDWAPVIEDLLSFKMTAVRDSVPMDGCTIQAATKDAGIVQRLSVQAQRSVVTAPDCKNQGSKSNASSRSLLSIRRESDSIVADVYVKNGEYVHVATYTAFPAQHPLRFSFATVTLHDFGVAGPAPPPPLSPPRKY